MTPHSLIDSLKAKLHIRPSPSPSPPPSPPTSASLYDASDFDTASDYADKTHYFLRIITQAEHRIRALNPMILQTVRQSGSPDVLALFENLVVMVDKHTSFELTLSRGPHHPQHILNLCAHVHKLMTQNTNREKVLFVAGKVVALIRDLYAHAAKIVDLAGSLERMQKQCQAYHDPGVLVDWIVLMSFEKAVISKVQMNRYKVSKARAACDREAVLRELGLADPEKCGGFPRVLGKGFREYRGFYVDAQGSYYLSVELADLEGFLEEDEVAVREEEVRRWSEESGVLIRPHRGYEAQIAAGLRAWEWK